MSSTFFSVAESYRSSNNVHIFINAVAQVPADVGLSVVMMESKSSADPSWPRYTWQTARLFIAKRLSLFACSTFCNISAAWDHSPLAIHKNALSEHDEWTIQVWDRVLYLLTWIISSMVGVFSWRCSICEYIFSALSTSPSYQWHYKYKHVTDARDVTCK